MFKAIKYLTDLTSLNADSMNRLEPVWMLSLLKPHQDFFHLFISLLSPIVHRAAKGSVLKPFYLILIQPDLPRYIFQPLLPIVLLDRHPPLLLHVRQPGGQTLNAAWTQAHEGHLQEQKLSSVAAKLLKSLKTRFHLHSFTWHLPLFWYHMLIQELMGVLSGWSVTFGKRQE